MPTTPTACTRVSRVLLAASLTLFGPTPLLQSQSASPVTPEVAKPVSFEVASVKSNKKQDGRWRLIGTADGYSAAGVSLRQLIEEAYSITSKDRIAGGPPWLDDDKFDLEAKLNPLDVPSETKELSGVQHAALRALLADRFRLKVHLGSKVFPVYDLHIAKGGPKLGEATLVHSDHERCRVSRKGFEDCTMTDYAESLSYKSGRIVIDKTGLTGRFSFQAHWTSDATTDDTKSSGTSIFTALQEQLGLKLVPSTASLDILVIDSADHPTAN